MHPLVVLVHHVKIGGNILKVDDTCNRRRIRKTNIETPLIVPSFSSAFSNDPSEIGRIYESLKEYIYEVSLVSAYDLYYNYIQIGDITCSNLVFLDSGKYETVSLKKSRILKRWDQDLYLKTIKKLIPLTQFVIVNYDQKTSTENQINSANDFFNQIENLEFAKCFLYKPLSKKSNIISIKDIQKNIDLFSDFDILGFADKEIGNSFLLRCENIVKIREILYENGIATPIHIFGCLDPLTIICYYLCGADIFDGLAWLKYTFYHHLALYSNNYSLIKDQWTNTFEINMMSNSIENLNALNHLSSTLKHFSRTKNFESLNIKENVLQQVKSLTGTAGIDY